MAKKDGKERFELGSREPGNRLDSHMDMLCTIYENSKTAEIPRDAADYERQRMGPGPPFQQREVKIEIKDRKRLGQSFTHIPVTNVCKWEADEIEKRLLDEILKNWNDIKPKAVILIDGKENLSPGIRTMFKNSLAQLSKKLDICVVLNGFDNIDIVAEESKAICITHYGKRLIAKKLTESGNEDGNKHSKTAFVVLREGIPSVEGLDFCLKMQRLLFKEYNIPCLKIITGSSSSNVFLISKEKYFEDNIPALVIDCCDDTLHSCIHSLKTNPEMNICVLPAEDNYNELTTRIIIAICHGLNQTTFLLMDSSEEVTKNLAEYRSARKTSSIVLFPNMVRKKDECLHVELFEHYDGFEKALKNKEKLEGSNEKELLCHQVAKWDELKGEVVIQDSTTKQQYEHLKDCLMPQKIENYEVILATVESSISQEEVIKSCPILKFRHSLKTGDFSLAGDILRERALDIYPYIYFSISEHWEDASGTERCKILDRYQIKNGRNGEKVNSMISDLTHKNVGQFFLEDGRPNIMIVNPIQALMVNRLLCMQFDFVKILWRYDKKNSFTNSLLLWIIIKHILDKKIVEDSEVGDEFIKLLKFFEDAMTEMIGIDDSRYSHHSEDLLTAKSTVFSNRKLISVADEWECEAFKILPKGLVLKEWDKNGDVNEEDPVNQDETASDDKVDSSASKRGSSCCKIQYRIITKLRIHMIVSVAFYLSVAYYTLRPKSKEGSVLRWVMLALISSLTLDEIRQAVGVRGSICSSIKLWSSDGWNIMDAISMILYYIAFGLDLAGFSESRYLFAVFSLVWCLKFYQLLRAFESVGLYIIIMQKMLLHFWYFGLFALVALIGYGVFMTSILFPSHALDSWGTVLLMFVRPYLLLFAETGINEYHFSDKSTIFNTPKISVGYEVLIIGGMCVFMLFGAIFLMNLLIAVFTGVYEEVKTKSERLWVINNLDLLDEFKSRPSLPVPFSFPQNIWYIGKRFCYGRNKSQYRLSDEERVQMGRQQERAFKRYLENNDDKIDSYRQLKERVVEEFDKRINSLTRQSNELDKRINDLSLHTHQMDMRLKEISHKVDERFKENSHKIDEWISYIIEQNIELLAIFEKNLNS